MRTSAGLLGALHLARGRADGIAGMPHDPAGVARSFWAAGICLPAFLALRLMDWETGGLSARPVHALALILIAYVANWAGFALLSHRVCQAWGQGARWPLFIAAWNWCSVVQYLLLVAARIPVLFGAPDWLGETAALVAAGWALWLEWYAGRLTLGSPLTATVLVILEVVLGEALTALSIGLF
jgi:hypothetical protein